MENTVQANKEARMQKFLNDMAAHYPSLSSYNKPANLSKLMKLSSRKTKALLDLQQMLDEDQHEQLCEVLFG